MMDNNLQDDRYKTILVCADTEKEARIELDKEVNKHIRDGWKPQGGASFATEVRGGGFYYYHLCQAMIKE